MDELSRVEMCLVFSPMVYAKQNLSMGVLLDIGEDIFVTVKQITELLPLLMFILGLLSDWRP